MPSPARDALAAHHKRRAPRDELFVEYPGLNPAHGALAPLPDGAALSDMNEIWTRMVLRTPVKAAACCCRAMP